MQNVQSQKQSNDSGEAIQAFENSIKILAKMIVNAVLAELLTQEKIVGQLGGSLTTIISSKANNNYQQEQSLVFSVSEASKLLGISRNTAYSLTQTGQIPCIKYGKRIVIPRFALIKMLEEVGTVKPATIP